MTEFIKIRSGGYREIFTDGSFVYKKLLSYRTKNYFSINVDFPLPPYCFLKFGILDFNEEEFANYQKFKKANIPNFEDNFATIHSFIEINGIRYLKSDLIRDYNDENSQTLSERKPSSEEFWQKLDFVLRTLIENDIFLFDLNSRNIFVKKISETEEIPVFFDYKRIGRRTYLCQPNLFFRNEKVRKVHRHLEHLIEKYK